MFTVGEFSRATGITIKALHIYHEQGLLVPTSVDPQTGYRYYGEALVDRARMIVFLRGLEFPLDEIAQILRDADDDQSLLLAMERHKSQIDSRIRLLRGVARSLEQFIKENREVIMSTGSFEVQEKSIDRMLIAGMRMKGRYSDCGKGFAKICRSFGRYIAGPCLMLHYDTEYKETDADFEACLPVRQSKDVEGINVRELPSCRCVTLLHRGPYDQLGPSYAKVFGYVHQKGYKPLSPTREVYVKGPGMIFKGNPKKYLTEIQIPIEPAS